MLNFFKKKQAVKELEDYNKNVIHLGNEFISSSPMLLDKPVSGEFYCLEELVVDEAAHITGNITTMRCVIKGRIDGNVLCLKNIIIKNTAIIEGEITAGTVEVESGAMINGCITLQRDLQAPHLIQKVKECEGAYGRPRVPVLRSTEIVEVVSSMEKKESIQTENTSSASEPIQAPASEQSAEKSAPKPSINTLPTTNGSKWW